MKDTNIEWATHTFNIIRGCEKYSPGCANCYAATLAKRNPGVLGHWGKMAPRIYAAASYREQPFAWNRKARKDQVASKNHLSRPRVFCPSLGDIFEEYQGGRILDTSGDLVHTTLTPVLLELLTTIRTTPYLDWLLLTKRPHNIIPALQTAMVVGQNSACSETRKTSLMIHHWIIEHSPPKNVWLGTSVESQAYLHRAHILSDIPATLRFLSCEPLLGPLVIPDTLSTKIDWIIVGGESGAKARPMDPDWVRFLRDQCRQSGITFFFKQWGSHHPDGTKAGKKSTGNLLDGKQHLDIAIPIPF